MSTGARFSSHQHVLGRSRGRCLSGIRLAFCSGSLRVARSGVAVWRTRMDIEIATFPRERYTHLEIKVNGAVAL